ncbi:MAG: glucokinase [Pseudomonadota bacterium]
MGHGEAGVGAADVAEYATAEQAIHAYLESTGHPDPSVICLAAAGPVVAGAVKVTNSHWELAAERLQREFAGAPVELLNDFAAVAYSLPLLGAGDLRAIGTQPTVPLDAPSFTVGVLGPGTGLGVAGLIRRNGRSVAVSGEGGHVGFAPESDRQSTLLEELRRDFERVSDERVVSGQGLENIYRALARLAGRTVTGTSAADVYELAEAGDDKLAAEALDVFYVALGQVAGNLALTLGAADGVFIAGGVAQRYPELLAASRFREGFENKGRHRRIMRAIPTSLITHPQPGLLGASDCAVRLAHRRSV